MRVFDTGIFGILVNHQFLEVSDLAGQYEMGEQQEQGQY